MSRGLARWLLAAIVLSSASLSAPLGEVIASPSFDVDEATEAYLTRLTPEEKERSDDYFEGLYWLQLWNFLCTLGAAWLLLETRLSARLRDLTGSLTRHRPVQTGLYVILYVLVTGILLLPMEAYEGFFRERRYGLASLTFGAWLRDHLVALGVTAVALASLLVPFYGILRRAPRTWWAWGAGLGVVFLVLMLLIGPLYIEPIFNVYTPIEDERIREPILSIARAYGFQVENIYKYDASSQTTRINASVGGILGTLRIRLNDNMLDRCTSAEIKAALAHEIGHVVMHHVYRAVIHLGIALAAGLALVRWTFDRICRRWGDRWAVKGTGDIAGLPLLAALLAAFVFFMTPLLNTYIRVNEAEADLFALSASGEPEGLAEIALKLGEYRKLDPGPLEEWIFFDHPSGQSRIRMAMTWKAEHPSTMPPSRMRRLVPD